MERSPPSGRDARLLGLWEAAVGQGGRRRAAALVPDEGGTLGARNLALLALRNALFDRRWPFASRCPECAETCEFEVDARAFAEELGRLTPERPAGIIEWEGRAIAARPFTAGDLEAVARCPDRRTAARALIGLAVEGMETESLSDEEVEIVGDRLEALDPAAAVAFDLGCPTCGTRWSAALDIAEALWSEVQRASERVLTEIDALARAYGWTEAEVLALSPLRRAAYIQLSEGP